ncbi:MAG: phosphatidate cytidylyltransferase [Rhizobiales bacterium]|nr:phosphatidate cytidylyltransferase [Hyphomicrobiales bacterium]
MLIMMAGFAYIGLKEWSDLPSQRNFSFETKRKWFGYGVLYVITPCAAILLIRFSDNPVGVHHINYGFAATIWVLSIAIATDVGAYFAGRFIGGPKVAPSISPNKTWVGVVGGIVVAVLFSIFVLAMFNLSMSWVIFKLVIGFSIISQCGDFFESHIKRKFSVKDTGAFLPGHGGLLDRMDGQIFVMVAAGIYAFLRGPIDEMAFSLIGG